MEAKPNKRPNKSISCTEVNHKGVFNQPDKVVIAPEKKGLYSAFSLEGRCPSSTSLSLWTVSEPTPRDKQSGGEAGS